MKSARSTKKESGFTLVELIVVLVILATLAALLVPSLTGCIDKARQNAVIAKARAVLVASQVVVTEAYADGKLVLDEYGWIYTTPKPDIAHAMAKEIMALAEITENECEWRIYIVSPIEEEFGALATILQLDYCDKSYRVTYRAVATEYDPAGWGQPVPAESLPKLEDWDTPAFLTSDAYDPDHFHPDN
ncbi:prepilin-type N-terminal cleavage/methylation domain-containing protein [uncultured Gemmiger sp.]|jgi:prepilin-type N-terminal cleavage/methylation domain-containing protein|uniref:prepilin-type N-terminal cleavage/methylation domain-containing protein n=1 Tax=uncultured Gemmiger sp. TaxID=1623490 RepID=UPI0025F91413|nr:prepilin-type N-terminal cleavage/methylation domain-containing protein [uncultured Gemmiger sp.]